MSIHLGEQASDLYNRKFWNSIADRYVEVLKGLRDPANENAYEIVSNLYDLLFSFPAFALRSRKPTAGSRETVASANSQVMKVVEQVAEVADQTSASIAQVAAQIESTRQAMIENYQALDSKIDGLESTLARLSQVKPHPELAQAA